MASAPRQLPPAVAQTLVAFRERLYGRFASRLTDARLFCSWARGDQTEESDVDVLVTVRQLTRRERDEIRHLAWDVDFELNEQLLDISTLVYSTDQARRMREGGRRLFRDIDAEGIPIEP